MKNNYLLIVLLFIIAFAKAQTNIDTDYEPNGDKIVTVDFEPPSEILITPITTTPVTVFGGDDGSISIEISGGTITNNTGNPYTVIIRRGIFIYTPAVFSGTTNGNVYEVTFTGLIAGSGFQGYVIQVTDGNGCVQSTSNITITQPEEFTFNTAFEEITQLNCYGDTGAISVRAQGGIAPYQYELFRQNDGTPGVYTPVDTSLPLSANESYTSDDLSPGVYKIEVVDNNGNGNAMIVRDNINIASVDKVSFVVTSFGNVSCFGADDGFINVDVSGGSGIYTYSWIKDGLIEVSTQEDIANLEGGVYTLTVTDSNICTDQDVPIDSKFTEISAPTQAINITLENPGVTNPTSVNGTDGSIRVDVEGGTLPYEYIWRDVTTAVITEISTAQDLINIGAGDYELTVIDANMCTETFTSTLIDPEPVVAIIQEITPINCNGETGTLEATGTGGSGSYDYQWFSISGGTATNTGIATSTLSNVLAGMYRVEITDQNGISDTADYTLIEPSAIEISNLLVTDVSCKNGDNGAISATVSGGTGTLAYAWRIEGTTVIESTNLNLVNVAAETYILTVTDDNGCIEESDPTVVGEPENVLEIALDSQTNVAINGQSTGSLDISITGGTPEYTINWERIGDPGFSETTEDISNLGAGVYTVMVTDTNFFTGIGNEGCIAVASYTITEPATLDVTILENTSILCHGDLTGVLDANVIGGMPAYSYQWKELIAGSFTNIADPSATTPQLTGRGAGTYRVEVTDINTATATRDFILEEPLIITISNIDSQQVACFGETTGSIQLDVSGGTGSLAYEWRDQTNTIISSSQDLTGIGEGSYTLTVTDQNACSISSNTINISQPNAPLSIVEDGIIDLTGFETNDGAISISVDGGTFPYTYAWINLDDASFNVTSQDVTSLSAGTYTVTVTDANECFVQGTFVITQPELLEIIDIIESDSNLCFGNNSADLEASIIGGTEPYTYSWFQNTDPATILSTSDTVTNLAASIYTLVVTDANGNIAQNTNIVVTEPLDFSVTETRVDVLCNGQATGAIDISVSGGTPFTTDIPYNYIWSNGATTEDLENVVSGTYTVTITDANNCQTSFDVVLSEPTALTIDSNTITNVTGNGLSNGGVSVNITGGTPTYTYLWTDSNNTTLSTTNEITNVAAGIYTLIVTDANGCTIAPTDFEVVEPSALNVSVNTLIPITCFGEIGSLEAIVSGGVAPYLYSWTDETGTAISTTATLENIIAGLYNLTVTDQNGNLASVVEYDFTQPDPITVTSTITDVSCFNANDGSILLNISGGSETYDISWDYDVTNMTAMALDIPGGIYTVTIRDQNDASCALTQSFTVNEPEPYGIENIMVNFPSPANNDGSISLNIFGGTPPFTFNWVDQNGTEIANTNGGNTNSITGLSEGDYTLTVTDSSPFLCTIIDTFTLGLPGELLVNIEQTNEITCFNGVDGEITVTTNTGVNTFTWFDASVSPPVILPNLTTAVVQVPAGIYFVQVYDAVQTITEVSAPIVVSEPDPVTATATGSDVLCFENTDGSITINASGGSGSYQYIHRIAGDNYPTVWVDFDNGSSTTINTLAQGDYEIRVRDDLQCTFSDNGTIVDIPVTINQPEALTIDSNTITNVTGNGLSNGGVSVNVTGGTPTYTYLWIDSNNTTLSTTNEITNVAAGIYTLLVTDANGCTIAPTDFEVGEPDELVVMTTITGTILCNDDATVSIFSLASGGVPFSTTTNDYTFEWIDADTGQTIGSGPALMNLPAGSYYVLVTDANGNMVISETLVITEPDALNISLSADFILCGDGNDWTILSEVSGGTPGAGEYNYVWNTGANTADLVNVSPGDYTVSVTDQNGCIVTASISIIAPPVLEASPSLMNVTCFGGNDGVITVNPSGGIPPYTYIWNTGEITNTITDLEAGVYDLVIIDSNGCELFESYIIEEGDEINIDLGEDVTLCIDQTLTLDANIPDGASYSWSSDNGFTSDAAIVELAESGTYTITAFTTNGCVVSDEITISKTDLAINAEFLISTQVFTNEPVIVVQVSEPVPNTVEWIFPEEATVIFSDNDIAELSFDTAGVYEISILIGNGSCTDIQTKEIIVIDGESFDTAIDEEESPIIQSFLVFPNPSNGVFTLDVELREVLPLSAKIFTTNSNIPISQKNLTGESHYIEPYNLSIPSGVYFLLLEAPNSTVLKKLIIQ